MRRKRKASPAADRTSLGASAPPALAEQLCVGVVVAGVTGLADAAVAAARGGLSDGAGVLATATAHLLAMQMPLGVVAGLGVGGALLVVRRTRWLAPLRWRFSRLRRLWAPEPRAFATAAGAVTALGAFGAAVRAAAEHFATRYHDPGLAAWAMAAATVALAGAAVLLAAAVTVALRPVGRLMGRAASVGTVAVLAVVALGVGAAVVLARSPHLLRAYDPVALVWVPSAVVLYAAVAAVLRRALRRRGISRRRLVLAASGMAAVSAGALVWTGADYGYHNRVRTVLEQRSVAGLRLLRLYQGLTDRDGDGHSFAFGGWDCDDGNPDVHPGAVDIEGDGIDADCFAGDGTPEVAASGDGAYAAPPAGLERPSFLLITIDALRPDHLGCYGYDRPTSPNIDAFAERSVRFEEAVAQSSRSIRSIPAMRTGLHPSQIEYGPEYLWPTFEPANVTLAEALRDAGYQTSVVMGTDYFERVAHFFQGFETVDQIDVYRPPRHMPVDRALRELGRLQGSDRPWFLWVHLFNVHEEYLWDDTPSKFGDRPVDAYDTEIALADGEVRRLLDALDERDLTRETVVVLASDHGEAFGEHGNRGHAATLYQEELRVPLMFRVPGVEPHTVEQTVALFDLMPTVLNLAGVELPRPIPARSLVSHLTRNGRHPTERLLFSELLPDGLYPHDQKAIRRGDDKLIWWVREGRFQLFDLASDPGEQRDRSDAQRGLARELLGLLRAWVGQASRPEQRRKVVIDENRLDREPVELTRRLDARWPGMFTLLGFDMAERRFRPGERIKMDFYYRVASEIDRNLFFYVDIEGPPGFRVPAHFHAHHYPLNGRYPTTEWRAGEILRDPVEMVIPEDIDRPVQLRITLRVLDGRRPLPFRGPGDGRRLELATVDIE